MIKTKNLTPENYYKQSRDFQLIGRIFDFVLNYLKTNIDTVSNNPFSEDFDLELTKILATSLGFKQSHEYNNKQLKALCSTFIYLLRNKGNIKSIENLLNLLANTENNADKFIVDINTEVDPYNLLIYIPLDVKDTTLFEDVLKYILPAGMSYTIISQLLLDIEPITTKFTLKEGDVTNFISNSIVKAGIVKNVSHSAKTAQILRADYADLPLQSDTETGRLDNMTIVRVEETGKTYRTLITRDSKILRVIFESTQTTDLAVTDVVSTHTEQVVQDYITEPTKNQTLPSVYRYKITIKPGNTERENHDLVVYAQDETEVKIPANISPFKAEVGKIFKEWTVSGCSFDDITDPAFIILKLDTDIPAEERKLISVTATWEDK